MKHLGTRAVRCLLVLALLSPLLASSYVHTVTAEVTGTTYTSPHFGYSITWQTPWYVTEDDTDNNGFDILGLADDQSIVYLSGGTSGASNPNQVIEEYADQIRSSSDWANLDRLDASQCPVTPPSNSAAACYSGQQTFSDGATGQTGVFLQAWDLGDGLDILLEAYIDQSQLAAYLPKWQTFGIYPQGQPVPTSIAGGCDSTIRNGIDFCFDADLPERDRDDIAEAVRLGQDVIAQYFGDPAMTGVRINGFSTVSSEGDESLATTLGRSIAVYAGSNVWQSIPPVERIQTLVHEFFHVYQNMMTENSDAVLPLWFTEGTAEAVGYLAAAQLGVTDQTEFYDMAAYSLTEYPLPETLEDLQPVGSMTADAYPLAYMAIQYLLGSKGLSVSALGDVYTELANGAPFEQAFQTVFGETLDRFYIDFGAWRPTLQSETELPDDFYPNDGTTQPAAITMQTVPQNAARDQQIVAVGKTLPLTECDLTAQLGAVSLERQTFSNGEGEVFWLLTIPPDAPAGPASLTFACGSAPTTIQLTIS
ncbi:MAG TPA: hypothetical protein VFP05_08700 [Thermomicrobiales bacterium]|nr:hypothetical protein [Thermomicrobiales bacterium]